MPTKKTSVTKVKAVANTAKTPKAVKKPVTKAKSSAKRTVAKAKPPAKPKVAKPVVSKAKPKRASSPIFLGKEEYNNIIEGMMAQGLDRADAVETLKLGIRQANGRPIPAELTQPEGASSIEGAEDAGVNQDLEAVL